MARCSGLLSRVIVAAFLLCVATAAHAEKRVALVIGNSAYQTVEKLPNPAADAKLMSDTLLSLGFFVVGGGAQLDLDKDGFDAALKKFGTELIGADVALFYFAGHGVEAHGQNYLVPVDVRLADDGDVFARMVDMSRVLDTIEKSGTRINLLLLDACRNNPFRDRVPSISAGLAQMQAPAGTFISFATQPRSVSFDGDDGHSPYTRALAATLQHPGLGLFRTFNEVGLAVEKATQGRQLPWLSSSPITGNFYFAGKAASAPVQQVSLSPEAPASPTRLSDDVLRRDLVTDCDRLAGMPNDTGHAPSLAGIELDGINVPQATTACNEAMQRYPDVARFLFEAGRVANARKDYAEARRLYDKAAAVGYPMALNNIGGMYEGGQGVRVDNAEAARWYRKAVEAGEPIAMVDLGWLEETGHGVARNCAEAVQLYETAVKAGVPSAMNNLGLLYLRGQCVRRDYNEARRLFEQGIALGDAACMNGMGVIYNEGDGVPRNARLARQWYEKAASLGDHEARQNLTEMRR
ncbi:caspase family protein [Afipia sp. GAS231]|uniref:caspase family protein n=1 Tax=Afipia sp. GAS231 TaxID=1882747 RepID=UPI00087BFD5C|nr:caspase family protein [Afipia sp. GAS231]SDN71675.1 Sel1 repeat-containing protein [Afipia sp. GAS231]